MSLARMNRAPRARVLHVPYTYFPDPSGGTEVYVQGLALRLAVRGFPSAIAAPGAERQSYRHKGLDVYRFEIDRRKRMELAYGQPDEIAAECFKWILDTVQPDIVHFHARTSAISTRLVEHTQAIGARAILTYHTPTVSCARGTMMLFGKRACDGLVDRGRCTACCLAEYGVPAILGRLSAAIPDAVVERLEPAQRIAKPLGVLRSPLLIARRQDQFRAMTAKVDHVVAVCEWVRQVLLRNGIPEHKITLSRQGIELPSNVLQTPLPARTSGPLRIAYFGRVDHAKAPDLLVAALARIPDTAVQLHIFAIRPAVENRDWRKLEALVGRDERVALKAPLPPEEIVAEMARYDLVAIPSRWLETGPLVALEAFAAGVPVLGADHGGIAELVCDGRGGILVAPDNIEAWAKAIGTLACDTGRVAQLRTNLPVPRSINNSAEDMRKIYCALLGARYAAGRSG